VSFRFLLRPKWIAWTVVVLAAVGVMGRLSLWQYDRLQDRRQTNAVTAARSLEPVVNLDAVAGDDPAELRYRTVEVTGTYLAEGEVLVANQTLRGAPGWHVLTPLRSAGGAVVLVNRGWVPFSTVDPDGSFAAFAPPTGEVRVTGRLLAGDDRGDAAGADERTVPRLDVALMTDRLGADGLAAPTDVLALWLQLKQQVPAQQGEEPIVLPAPQLDDGPHLNYTGQWAIFATLTLVVFVVLVVRTAQRGGDGAGSARRAARASDTPDDLRALLSLRLAPLVTASRLTVVADLDEHRLRGHLDGFVSEGLARYRDAAPAGWTLTPNGHRTLERRLATELDDAGLRPAVEVLYRRFLRLNPQLLQVVTDWQVRPDGDGRPAVNDHGDAGYDAEVVLRLGQVDDEAAPLLSELASLLSRFAGYRGRLTAARHRVESGDGAWVAGVGVDSFHMVWFELHEHLLATLGLQRGGEHEAAPPGQDIPAQDIPAQGIAGQDTAGQVAAGNTAGHATGEGDSTWADSDG
jgi:cytochrome oxidase assembly protein ShyY1